MMSSTEAIPTAHEMAEKGEATKVVPSSETNGISNDAPVAHKDATAAVVDGVTNSGETATSVPQSSDQQIPEGLMFMPTTAGGTPMHMAFSPFPSGEGWTPTFDPNIMGAAGFGFTPAGPSMVPHQHMQNQFYFPGADMGIWGHGDPLSLYLLSPAMAMEPGGSAIPLDPSMTNSVDPVTGLAQGFTGMTLNGTVMPAVGQTPVIATPSSSNSPGGVDSSAQNSGAGGAPSTAQGQSSAPQPEKPKSWAAIASQPAKPRPPPPPKPQPPPPDAQQELPSRKPQSVGGVAARGGGPTQQSKGLSQGASGGGAGKGRRAAPQHQTHPQPGGAKSKGAAPQSDIVGKLQSENKYNPSDMNMDLTNARFFVIKSYSEDDIHRSIKYSIWTSTEHGNRRLEQAFREQKGRGNVYLFFSVNGSGHFCGMAQMMSEVDFNTTTGVWAQDKWKGRFDVKWVYVKDVPNSQLRHIRLENNENKPVTNSRDTQEVPLDKARQVVKIIHHYHHTTSIFDDFEHYEKKQEEDTKKKPVS